MTTSNPPKSTSLTPFERFVIEQAGTERPFTGQYVDTVEPGTYVCRRCRTPLYRSDAKFASHCGWPSFDDEIRDAVKRLPDPDGSRTEIRCATCDAHLGHVFHGEGYTAKNLRHCVNSVSLEFVPAADTPKRQMVVASGCFWGTEFHFAKAPGVLSTEVGYAGGRKENPTYEEVCRGDTGHVEAVRVTYDPRRTSFEQLAKLFFETHDFTQRNGQGPDIGPQYLSVLFVGDDEERKTAEKIIGQLREKGSDVATEVRSQSVFYPAEDYHQKYYFRNAKTPYCHVYRKIF